jgi:hypothetical protein
MPFYGAAGIILNGRQVSQMNFLGAGAVVDGDQITINGFVIKQGAFTISDPTALEITSNTATLAAEVTAPSVVQFYHGAPLGAQLPNPVTVGNLIVFLCLDNIPAFGGFSQIYTENLGDQFVALEQIATSSVSPVCETNGPHGNASLMMEIENCQGGEYAPVASFTNSGGVQTFTTNVPGSIPGLLGVAIRADDTYPSAPYLPAGVTPFPSGGSGNPGSYNGNCYLINETLTQNGEVTFGCDGMNDVNGAVQCFYGANPASVVANLTI